MRDKSYIVTKQPSIHWNSIRFEQQNSSSNIHKYQAYSSLLTSLYSISITYTIIQYMLVSRVKITSPAAKKTTLSFHQIESHNKSPSRNYTDPHYLNFKEVSLKSTWLIAPTNRTASPAQTSRAHFETSRAINFFPPESRARARAQLFPPPPQVRPLRERSRSFLPALLAPAQTRVL